MPNKLEQLKTDLKQYKKLAIAYSGGVDSHFLAHAAIDALGKENVLLVLVQGAMMPEKEKQEAKERMHSFKHIVLDTDVFEVEAFKYNDPKRCYYCKKNIMSKIQKAAKEAGFTTVADGKNADDEKVYRPGSQALKELHIVSPLALAGLSKEEIRKYSYQMNLDTYDKPANACLATRFNYHTLLDEKKLRQVEMAEETLHDLGFVSCRVRTEKKTARIEVEKEQMENLVHQAEKIVSSFKQIGYETITMDLEGISSGKYDKKLQ